jgi:hypothetical protein
MFYPLEGDTSHQADFPLMFIWNLFCGTKYPTPPGNIAPKFNNKYVTYMKWNQSKSTMGESFSNGLIVGENMWAFQWTLAKLGVPAENET